MPQVTGKKQLHVLCLMPNLQEGIFNLKSVIATFHKVCKVPPHANKSFNYMIC